MSATDVLITSGFATVLEKIEKTSKLRGLSGTSNASAEATETVRKLERRVATFLDTEEISQDFLSTMADAAEVCQVKSAKLCASGGESIKSIETLTFLCSATWMQNLETV